MEQLYFKDPTSAEKIRRIYASSRLMPFFGSGFTKGERARKGRVPDANGLTEQIVNMASQKCQDPKAAAEILQISDLKTAFNLLFMKDYIEPASTRTYLRNMFSEVDISKTIKGKLIQLKWPHIFTFNIDDAIESCTAVRLTKILPNRDVAREYISSSRCLFKIHGDVEDLCAYTDGSSTFTWAQYAKAIESNRSMLSFIQEHAEASSFLFIGCSLDSEIDILSLAQTTPFAKSIFLKKGEPTLAEKIKLSDYGIEQIIFFDNYEQIAQWLVETLEEVVVSTPDRSLQIDDFADINANQTINLIANGGPLLLTMGDQRAALCPRLFPVREQVKAIVRQVQNSPVVLVSGRRFSGKTTLLLQCIESINDYTTSFFATSDSFSPSVANLLSTQNNHIFFFDSNYLDTASLDAVLNAKTNPSNRIVICATKGDADLFRLKISNRLGDVTETTIESKLSQQEEIEFNSGLNNLGLAKYNRGNNLLNFAYHYFTNYRSQIGTSALFERKFNNNELKVLVLIATFGKAERGRIKAVCENFDIIEFISNNDRLLESIPGETTTSSGAIVCNSASWIIKIVTDSFKDQAVGKRIGDMIIALANQGYIDAARNLISFDKLNEISGGSVNSFVRDLYNRIQKPFENDNHYWIQRAKSELISGHTIEDFSSGMKWTSKVRGDNSITKNATYFSATFVSAQLYARAFGVSKNQEHLRMFFEHMHESTNNYLHNKIHIDKMLRSVKPDIKQAVAALESTKDPFFLERREDVRELVAMFHNGKPDSAGRIGRQLARGTAQNSF